MIWRPSTIRCGVSEIQSRVSGAEWMGWREGLMGEEEVGEGDAGCTSPDLSGDAREETDAPIDYDENRQFAELRRFWTNAEREGRDQYRCDAKYFLRSPSSILNNLARAHPTFRNDSRYIYVLPYYDYAYYFANDAESELTRATSSQTLYPYQLRDQLPSTHNHPISTLAPPQHPQSKNRQHSSTTQGLESFCP